MTVKDLIPIMVGWSYLGDVVARQAREAYERYDVVGANLNALAMADERVLAPMVKLAEKLGDDELCEDIFHIRQLVNGEDDDFTKSYIEEAKDDDEPTEGSYRDGDDGA